MTAFSGFGSLGERPIAVFRELSQRAGRGEVEHEADRLEDFLLVRVVAVRVLDRPRRLHAERRLEIGFRRFEVAQHQDRRPLRHRDTRGELAARQRDGLGLESAADGSRAPAAMPPARCLPKHPQRPQPHSRARTCCASPPADSPSRDRPATFGRNQNGMLQVRQQAHVRVRERRPRPGLEMFDGPGRIPAANHIQPLLHVAFVLELRANRPSQ